MQYYETVGQFQKGEYLITRIPLTDEEIKEIAEKVVQLLSEWKWKSDDVLHDRDANNV